MERITLLAPISLNNAAHGKPFLPNATIRLAGQGFAVTQPDRDNKFFKISIVLNVVIMNVFCTLNLLTNFGNRDIGLTIAYYVVFAVSLILANFLVYQYFKKQTKLPAKVLAVTATMERDLLF